MSCFAIFSTSTSWKRERFYFGDYIRRIPAPWSKHWRPADYEYCECQTKARGHEPFGWRVCKVKSTYRNHHSNAIHAFIQFNGLSKKHSEIISLEYLRPKNNSKRISTRFVVEKVINVPYYANDIVQNSENIYQMKKRLISLYYREKDHKLVLIGTKRLVDLTANLVNIHFGIQAQNSGFRWKEKFTIGGHDLSTSGYQAGPERTQIRIARQLQHSVKSKRKTKEKENTNTKIKSTRMLMNKHEIEEKFLDSNMVKCNQLSVSRSIADEIDDIMAEIIEIEQIVDSNINYDCKNNEDDNTNNIAIDKKVLLMHLSNVKNKLNQARAKCNKSMIYNYADEANDIGIVANSIETSQKNDDEIEKCNYKDLKTQIETLNKEIRNNKRESPMSLLFELKRLEKQTKIQHKILQVRVYLYCMFFKFRW